MKFIFLMQARMGSTRRPGKMLVPILGDKTLFESVYSRVAKAKEVTKENFYVLTSTSSNDDPLVDIMKEKGMLYARGDEQNVYKRFYDFLDSHNPKPDYIIRICGDNPFLEPESIDQITDYLKNNKEAPSDYIVHQDSSGQSSMGTQYGFFAEAIKYDAFMKANEFNLTDIEKEHVTPQFYKSDNRPLEFSVHFIPMAPEIDLKPYRFTVDTDNDLYVVTTIANELPEDFSYKDVILIATKHPDVLKIMADAVSGDKKAGR